MSARLRRLVGRGVQYYRSHGLLATIHKLAGFPGYGVWRRIYAAPAPAQRRAMRAQGQRLSRQPLISVVMPVYQTPERFLRSAIQSVREQIYPNWQLCIVDDASPDAAIGRLLAEAAAADSRIRLGRLDRNDGIAAASNAALAMAGGDYVAFLDHDDALAPDALFAVAMEINAHPEAELIYSDEDKLDPAGRHRDPYFKPDWNADLLLGQNYLNHLLVVRRSRLDQVGGFRLDFEGSQDHDLVLRLAEGIEPAHIRHIPRVLYHWRMVPTSFSTARLSSATAAAGRAVAEHLARQGIVAAVEPDPATGRYLRVRRPLPEPPPRVTLVVPTRDKVCLLRQCIDGLLDGTDYPDLEIIVVDHDSQELATESYLGEIQKRGVRVLRYSGPFNYSAINNLAVGQASGQVIGLLNNDIKVIHADWLREMVSQALRPDIGAVGAKLYFMDGTIQHAGVVTGLGGVAGHLHQFQPKDHGGNFNDVNLVREVSAVTAACMVLKKSVYDEVGGLDQEQLAVAFNDVDLCLKIRAKGYRILWTPFAELYHLESATRGLDLAPEKAERFRRECEVMRQRWGAALTADPFYNPNLTLDNARGGPAFPPRVERLWKTVG